MTALPQLRVTPDGWMQAGDYRFRCALGRGGVRQDKCEGDGATPVGNFPLRRLHYRQDRHTDVETSLIKRAIQPADGWCDDPGSDDYNRLVTLPHPARHEEMWRDDHLYDLVIEIGHNDDPVVAGDGSAVFIHLAKPDYAPTEGCVALAADDMLTILARVSDDTVIEVVAE